MLVCAMGWALTLSYEDALRSAGEKNPTVLGAAQDTVSAQGALLAANASYEPTLTADGTWYNESRRGYYQQLGSEFFQESEGWATSAQLVQAAPTGTSVELGLAATKGFTFYRLDAFDQEEESDTYVSELSLRLSQAVLQGHRLAYNLQGVRAAQRSLTVAEARAHASRQQALADAARLYWELHRAGRAVVIARATVDLQREQQRVTLALVESGKLAVVERTRIDAAVAQAEVSLLDAESVYTAARDALLVQIGEGPGQEVQLTSLPARPPELVLDAPRVVEAVLAGNQDLAAARIVAEGAQTALRDARHATLPELGVTGGVTFYGFDDTGSLGGALQEMGSGKYRNVNVGGALTVPLLNRADRGAVAQRAAEAEKARLDVIALERVLDEQARAQLRTLDVAREKIELAELNVRLAEETLAAERARLVEGRAVQKDVIQAVKDVDAARGSADGALVDYQIAVVELERLKGSL